MLNVFETGEETFRLSNSRDEEIGWVKGGALGLSGFSTEEVAIESAVRGSDALLAYLDRVSGSSQVADAAKGSVKLVNDGAYEWVTRGKTLLARLYRPNEAARNRQFSGYAVEFVLPSYVRSGTVISAAQVVYHAVFGSSNSRKSASAPQPVAAG
ncbi:MAG TPA: hypothetical protein VKZ41_11165 [Gemmatimonadales bacterium]|nr:hypothetical protein [Gemmatimonadales bacterium]